MLLPLSSKDEADYDKYKYIITIKIPSIEIQPKPIDSIPKTDFQSKVFNQKSDISFSLDIAIRDIAISTSHVLTKYLDIHSNQRRLSLSTSQGGDLNSLETNTHKHHLSAYFNRKRSSLLVSQHHSHNHHNSTGTTGLGSTHHSTHTVVTATTLAAAIIQAHSKSLNSQEDILLCPAYISFSVWGYHTPKSTESSQHVIGLKCHIVNLEFFINEFQLDHIFNATTLMQKRVESYQNSTNLLKLWNIAGKYYQWKVFNFDCERFYLLKLLQSPRHRSSSSDRQKSNVRFQPTTPSGNNTSNRSSKSDTPVGSGRYRSFSTDANYDMSYYSYSAKLRYKWRFAIRAVVKLIRIEKGLIPLHTFNTFFTQALSKHYSSLYKRLLITEMLKPAFKGVHWYINKLRKELLLNSDDNIMSPDIDPELLPSKDTQVPYTVPTPQQYFCMTFYMDALGLSDKELNLKLSLCQDILNSKEILIERIKIHLFMIYQHNVPIIYIKQVVTLLSNPDNKAVPLTLWQWLTSAGSNTSGLAKFQGMLIYLFFTRLYYLKLY